MVSAAGTMSAGTTSSLMRQVSGEKKASTFWNWKSVKLNEVSVVIRLYKGFFKYSFVQKIQFKLKRISTELESQRGWRQEHNF